MVRVWDVKTQQNVVTFEGHKGTVSSLNFSENGFYLVTAGPDGFKSWDLRKVAKQGAQVRVRVSAWLCRPHTQRERERERERVRVRERELRGACLLISYHTCQTLDFSYPDAHDVMRGNASGRAGETHGAHRRRGQ